MIGSMDVHARINDFLQHKTLVSLVPSVSQRDEWSYTKAGVVPFVYHDNQFLFQFMKPVAKNASMPEPAFQICKGTRMRLDSLKGWCDMKEHETALSAKEPLLTTALREGIEELGLKLDVIAQILDVGSYPFSSEKTAKTKHMWLYALEMSSMEDMLPMSAVAGTTSERAWLAPEQFDTVGRSDHRAIVRSIETMLDNHYN